MTYLTLDGGQTLLQAVWEGIQNSGIESKIYGVAGVDRGFVFPQTLGDARGRVVLWGRGLPIALDGLGDFDPTENHFMVIEDVVTQQANWTLNDNGGTTIHFGQPFDVIRQQAGGRTQTPYDLMQRRDERADDILALTNWEQSDPPYGPYARAFSDINNPIMLRGAEALASNKKQWKWNVVLFDFADEETNRVLVKANYAALSDHLITALPPQVVTGWTGVAFSGTSYDLATASGQSNIGSIQSISIPENYIVVMCT